MSKRVVTTASSVWTFDLDAMTYTRVSRSGDEHPNIAYTDEARAFTSIEPWVDRLIVSHPDGAPYYTGTVLDDVTTGNPRRVFATLNIRHTFSLDVTGEAPGDNRVFAEHLAERLQEGFIDAIYSDLAEVLIEPTVEVKAVVTSMPIPSSPDTEPREEIAP